MKSEGGDSQLFEISLDERKRRGGGREWLEGKGEKRGWGRLVGWEERGGERERERGLGCGLDSRRMEVMGVGRGGADARAVMNNGDE